MSTANTRLRRCIQGNDMVRQGLVPDMFGVGEKITIRIAPMRDGSDGGYITAFITEDGEAVGRIRRAD